MAKERAARRAERERAAAARAEQRAADVAKQARRRARSQALSARLRRLVPRRRAVPGVLARKRRAQNRLVFGLAAVVQVFGWLAFGSVRTSLLILVLTAFALPVVVTLAFDRRA
jgi:Flp pilus assembly protein TadB